MVDKKKKTGKEASSSSDKEEVRAPRMVTQIIEIVEEEAEPEKKVEARVPEKEEVPKVHPQPKESPEEETETEQSEEEVEEEIETKEDKEVEQEAEKEEEREEVKEEVQQEPTVDKQKSTVEELFTKKEPLVMPEISVHSTGSSKRNMFLWALTMIVITVAIGGGLIIFSGGGTGGVSNIVLQASPTPSPSSTPTPTPAPVAVKKDELDVQVLNGGGVVGAASKMKAFLEEKGYTVAEVANAEEYTYEQTEVHVKKSAAGNLEEIKKELNEAYTVGTATEDLPDDSKYDIRVIVGKK